jgi:hypothetical protein
MELPWFAKPMVPSGMRFEHAALLGTGTSYQFLVSSLI